MNEDQRESDNADLAAAFLAEMNARYERNKDKPIDPGKYSNLTNVCGVMLPELVK